MHREESTCQDTIPCPPSRPCSPVSRAPLTPWSPPSCPLGPMLPAPHPRTPTHPHTRTHHVPAGSWGSAPLLQAHSRCVGGYLELRSHWLAGSGGPCRALGPWLMGSWWLPGAVTEPHPGPASSGPTAQRSLLPRSPPGSPVPIQDSAGPSAAKCGVGVSAVSPSLSLESPLPVKGWQPAGIPILTGNSPPVLS